MEEEKWTNDEEKILLSAVYATLSENDERTTVTQRTMQDVFSAIGGRLANKNMTSCALRLSDFVKECEFFATIGDVFPSQCKSTVTLNLNEWETFFPTFCRAAPPDFARNKKASDYRDAREFVATRTGALANDTTIGETPSTANDDLLPVDIFGAANRKAQAGEKRTEGTDKAHLAPQARAEALSWNYPAVAVFGLNMDSVQEESTKKAILGCRSEGREQDLRFPGMRNLLCNLLRMAAQQNLFDQNARVFVFPVHHDVRSWAGEGYDAIVLCEDENVARRIGMQNARILKKATLNDVNNAVEIASSTCKYLGYSVLRKPANEVAVYQKSAAEKSAHESFRQNRQVIVPLPFAAGGVPAKPIFKISFAAHGSQDQGVHPAPDPMLLAFKTCNNWGRKELGFRMVAGAEPQELDDLSSEGRQNLEAYVAYQAEEAQAQRHTEILSLFGQGVDVTV